MHWLASAVAIADTLPAVWLIATDRAPRNLDERSALRRSVAQDVLGRQLGQPVSIGHDGAGRPRLAGFSDLHISLATRGGVVAIALAQHPVGVDVEAVSGAPFPDSMLHIAEAAMLQALPAADQALAFAQIWAAKEAYVKALGTGFQRAPDSFVVVLEGDGFRIEDRQRPTAARGWLRTLSLGAQDSGGQRNGGQESLAAAVIILA